MEEIMKMPLTVYRLSGSRPAVLPDWRHPLVLEPFLYRPDAWRFSCTSKTSVGRVVGSCNCGYIMQTIYILKLFLNKSISISIIPSKQLPDHILAGAVPLDAQRLVLDINAQT